MVDLPANFEVRQAIGGGDCFFDSMAQGLKQLKPEINFTAKLLRKICKRFAQNQLKNDQSWLKEALKSEQQLIGEYIRRIEFTANDIHQESGVLNVLKLTLPIWGRSEIEGRIICAEYDVKLHIVENHIVEGKQVWTHQLVDSKGSRSVDAVDYNEEKTVHIVNTGCLHFEPILRIQKDQHNKKFVNPSCYRDKMKVEVQFIDITKDNDSQEKKLSEEPNDQAEHSLYENNINPAKTEDYSYQIKLLMLFLLNGKEKVEKGQISCFYLGTYIRKALDFNGIFFKFMCEDSFESKVAFLQVKHLEKETKVTKDMLLAGKIFNLNAYFENCMTFKKNFSNTKKGNLIFGANISNIDYSFIIFTNALPQFSGESDFYQKTVDDEDIMNFGEINYFYSLRPSEKIAASILADNDLSQKEELNEFLSTLKMFFMQPNEHKLDEIIKHKIQSRYSLKEKDVDQVFASVKEKMQEWHRKKGKSEILTNKNRFFEDVARVFIKFDVKEPVALFTGRTTELKDLHKFLQNTGKAVISQMTSVTYLGGVGKSELARKYISEYSNKYDDNVIWINAENYLTIAESFATVAESKLGINIFDEKGKRKKTQIIAHEAYKFFAKMQRKSLFVFDNTGKYKGYGDRDGGMHKFLPSGPYKPYILITSRDQEWPKIKTLTLNVFTKEEAAEFITKALTDITEVEESEVRRLAAELQYLPLTLTQAVAYIKMENKSEEGRFTIGNYLKLFKEKASEFSTKGSITENFDRYIESLMTVWKVTVEKIEQKRSQGGEQAVNILKVIAYLAPVKIPVDLIFCKLINMTEAGHNAVELLDQYSMASIKDGMLYVHRLVQRVTILELEGQGKNQEVIQETFTLLRESFPYKSNKFDDISRKKKLLPQLEMFLFHVDYLLRNKAQGTTNTDKDTLGELLTWMADGYTDLGEPKRTQELLEAALPNLEYSCGPNCAEVAVTLVNLGNAHGALGDHYKRRKLLERALKIQKQNYGTNHYEIAKTLHDLANTYGDLGDYFKRKKLLKEALKIQEVCYGKNHFEVVKTLINLGNAYGDLGYPHKQKELLERALKIQEKIDDYYKKNYFGYRYTQKEQLEHTFKIMDEIEDYYNVFHNPNIAVTLANLGIAYGTLGDPITHVELSERALKTMEDYYGPNHLKTAKILTSLAIAYGNLGDPYKQKELLEEALKIQEDHYGKNNPEVAKTLANLGIAYGDLGDPNMQKELLEEALKIQNEHYGPNHFNVAKALTNLANAYGALGDHFKKKKLLKRALEIKKNFYGRNHFEVSYTLANLGNACGDLGYHNKQKDLLEQALKIQEHHFKPNHFQVAKTLVNLGNAYGALGYHYKKKKLLERALKIQERHYGRNHFQVAKTLANLGNVCGDLGDHFIKKKLLVRALKIKEYYYGSNHVEVAKTLTNLGNAYGDLGYHYKQKELLEQALKIQEDHYGRNSVEVAKTLTNLGIAYGDLDDPYKQKELLEEVLKIQIYHYGPNHFEVGKTLTNLSFAHRILDGSYTSNTKERNCWCKH